MFFVILESGFLALAKNLASIRAKAGHKPRIYGFSFLKGVWPQCGPILLLAYERLDKNIALSQNSNDRIKLLPNGAVKKIERNTA